MYILSVTLPLSLAQKVLSYFTKISASIKNKEKRLAEMLGTLKSTLQGVSSSTYNLQDTVNSISSDGSSRPSSFKVSYKIDGVKIRNHFKKGSVK